jgi:hypothetical protein
MQIVIQIQAQDDDDELHRTVFYGTEDGIKETLAIYWAIHQGGWEEPVDAYYDTIEKMQEALPHLEMDSALPHEHYTYSMYALLDFSTEEISIGRGNAYQDAKEPEPIGMAIWLDMMKDFFEETLVGGKLSEASHYLLPLRSGYDG